MFQSLRGNGGRKQLLEKLGNMSAASWKQWPDRQVGSNGSTEELHCDPQAKCSPVCSPFRWLSFYCTAAHLLPQRIPGCFCTMVPVIASPLQKKCIDSSWFWETQEWAFIALDDKANACLWLHCLDLSEVQGALTGTLSNLSILHFCINYTNLKTSF